MQLTYNLNLNRYEFRCEREERDPPDDPRGSLGFALASDAGFKVQFHGARNPFWITADPFKAQQLAAHATVEVCERIKADVEARGGGVPVMTYRSGVYIWTGPQQANGVVYYLIPKRAGLVFSKNPSALPRQAGSGMTEPVWWTEQSVKAAQCAEYADEEAKLAIAAAMAKRHKALEASRAEDADLEIPYPDNGMEPFRYQIAGVAYAKPRKRVLFGDEMGLGKTIQAILWNNLIAEEKNRVLHVLVICPASLKRNWMRELERWLYRPTTIGIADTRYSQVVPSTDIVIINYEMLANKIFTGRRDSKGKKIFEHHLRDALRVKWDMLIVDEAHRLKGDPKEVIRSRMVFAIEAEYMAFLTGTPMVNRPRELWNLCHHLAPNIFKDKGAFMEKFCKGGGYMTPYDGAKNLDKLQELLRLWFMVRRLKKNVLKDLPPKLRQVIELPASGCEAAVKGELVAFSRKEEIFTSMRLRVELAKASDNPEDYKQAVKVLTEAIKVSFEDLSRVRKETAIAKIPVVSDHVAEILAEGHKVILFCHHKEVAYTVAESIERRLRDGGKGKDKLTRSDAALLAHDPSVKSYKLAGTKHVVAFSGDTSMTDRDEYVQRFQTDDQVRLFVGTIGAAGVGLTLTASSYVVFAELDWTPGNVTQAEDRAHRIGQKENVLIQHLVLEGSLDQRMATVLVEKQDIADRALDREGADELLLDPVTPDREKVATQNVSAKEVARLAGQLSARDIESIHYGMKLLAGKHKDAHLIDGLTFRDVDAPLGMILAGKKTLTPKLAALGRKFLVRYRNTQLGLMPEIAALFTKEKES